MTDVQEMMKLLYGKDVPRYLGKFMRYVAGLEFEEGERSITFQKIVFSCFVLYSRTGLHLFKRTFRKRTIKTRLQ